MRPPAHPTSALCHVYINQYIYLNPVEKLSNNMVALALPQTAAAVSCRLNMVAMVLPQSTAAMFCRLNVLVLTLSWGRCGYALHFEYGGIGFASGPVQRRCE